MPYIDVSDKAIQRAEFCLPCWGLAARLAFVGVKDDNVDGEEMKDILNHVGYSNVKDMLTWTK